MGQKVHPPPWSILHRRMGPVRSDPAPLKRWDPYATANKVGSRAFSQFQRGPRFYSVPPPSNRPTTLNHYPHEVPALHPQPYPNRIPIATHFHCATTLTATPF